MWWIILIIGVVVVSNIPIEKPNCELCNDSGKFASDNYVLGEQEFDCYKCKNK